MSEETQAVAAVPSADAPKPEVTVEPSQDAGTAGEPEQHADADSTRNEDRPKRKGGFQRVIERQQRQIDQLMGALQQRVPPPQAPEAPKAPDEPKPENYDLDTKEGWAKFNRDTALWAAKVERLAADRDREQHDQQAQQRSESERLAQTWDSKLTEARGAHADFDEVLAEAEIPISPAVRDAMMESEYGAEVLYYLASHPEEAAEVGKLTGRAADRAIGRIETLIAAEQIEAEEANQPQQAAPPPQTQAPPPPKPVRKTSPNVKPFDPNDAKQAEQMKTDEWIRERNKELQARGRR